MSTSSTSETALLLLVEPEEKEASPEHTQGWGSKPEQSLLTLKFNIRL